MDEGVGVSVDAGVAEIVGVGFQTASSLAIKGGNPSMVTIIVTIPVITAAHITALGFSRRLFLSSVMASSRVGSVVNLFYKFQKRKSSGCRGLIFVGRTVQMPMADLLPRARTGYKMKQVN